MNDMPFDPVMVDLNNYLDELDKPVWADIMDEPEKICTDVIKDFIDITDCGEITEYMMTFDKDKFIDMFINDVGYDAAVEEFIKTSRSFRAAFIEELEEAQARVNSSK